LTHTAPFTYFLCVDFGDILAQWDNHRSRKRGEPRGRPEKANAEDTAGNAEDTARNAEDTAGNAEDTADDATEAMPADHIGALLDRYPPSDEVRRQKDGSSSDRHEVRASERRRLRALRPQRSIDLHGLSADEAVHRVERFLRRSAEEGLEKVLIIHGKGMHSASEPVLGRRVKELLQRLPLAGEFGAGKREWGGRGVTWVILRGRRPS
jgi:DNA-nicking Smr family endonuclease